MTFVASEAVCSNAPLHSSLTSTFKVNLVERSRSDLAELDEERPWPDVVVDERTCILIHPLQILRSEQKTQRITRDVVALSLCFAVTYVVFQVDASRSYAFKACVVQGITTVAATCAQFRSDDYSAYLLLASSTEQVASLLRRIGEAARDASKCWTREDWLRRPWLTTSVSSHERFLLTLPCINSMAAQIMLTVMPLSKLLTSLLDDLLAVLTWIPAKMVKHFYMLVHRSLPTGALDSVCERGQNLTQGETATLSPGSAHWGESDRAGIHAVPGTLHPWEGPEDAFLFDKDHHVPSVEDCPKPSFCTDFELAPALNQEASSFKAPFTWSQGEGLLASSSSQAAHLREPLIEEDPPHFLPQSQLTSSTKEFLQQVDQCAPRGSTLSKPVSKAFSMWQWDSHPEDDFKQEFGTPSVLAYKGMSCSQGPSFQQHRTPLWVPSSQLVKDTSDRWGAEGRVVTRVIPVEEGRLAPVQPSPRVTLSQDQSRSILQSQRPSKRLAYQRTSDRGGQTRLVFAPLSR